MNWPHPAIARSSLALMSRFHAAWTTADPRARRVAASTDPAR